MPLRTLLIATIVILGLGLSPLAAKDWIFDDGPFTVDPKTGKRVDQYQKKAVPTAVPYDEFFSPNGSGAYIPFGYYEENLGIGFGYGGYGGYGGGYGYGYGAGYGFGSAYPMGGYAFELDPPRVTAGRIGCAEVERIAGLSGRRKAARA